VTRFVDEAVARAGLGPVQAARRAGDMEAVRATVKSWAGADLLALGAVADAARTDDVGDTVVIHERADAKGVREVLWVEAPAGGSELDLLRAVAVARITGGKGARVGVDWGRAGLELAQVALGFGASDLRGPIARKSGLPILEDEKKKVKGQGMVELRSLRRREIASLVTHAGRLPAFDDEPRGASNDRERDRDRESSQEVAGA